MIILGIDTSADDTSVAITDNRKVLSNIVLSQNEVHEKWGGMVPNLARNAHEENFSVAYQQALDEAHVQEQDIDVVAVTQGHGMAIALEVGVRNAKEIARRLQKPLVAVHHTEGHIFANFATDKNVEGGLDPETLPLPALCVVVAGGQTQFLKMPALGQYEVLGKTVDDDLGEGFDKAARLLGLPYPGGAALSKLAENGNKLAYDLPRPMRGSGDFNVSYAGLKTAFLKVVSAEKMKGELTEKTKADLAASYQHAAIDTLLIKVKKIVEQESFGSLLLGGGVAANPTLQKLLAEIAEKNNLVYHQPYSNKLCTDNAAMIAVVGWWHALRNDFVEDIEKLDRDPKLQLINP